MALLETISRLWRRVVAFLAQRMPVDSPSVCMGSSVLCLATAAFLLPGLGDAARSFPLVAAAFDASKSGWRILLGCEWAMIAGACGCAAVFQARCLQICYPETYDPASVAERSNRRSSAPPAVVIAGMPVDPDDLRTSILVTGVTGSAKTAGVLMPVLSQLFARYRQETDDEVSQNELQKLGAFIPEVKGDLVDGCIYLAHEAGRCVSRDVLILSPCSSIPVVRYRDEEGRFWFVCARGGSGGSEAGSLLPRIVFPEGHPRSGRPAPADVFESASDLGAIVPELSRSSIPLGASRPRFVGWRWKGRKLVRVSHTLARDCVSPVMGPDGAQVSADPPRSLVFDGMLMIDNGLHYNLVDARLPAAEAAERITRLASMARGGERHGDNDYFYEQGRKLIAACIALHREVEARPCTAADIVRLATQDERLTAALGSLAHKIERLKTVAASATEEHGVDLHRRQIAPAEDLAAFFRDEWQKMVADGKTANVIRSTITGAFDVFLRDPDLADTFCTPSTFSFEDIAQSGKIIGLVPGDRYEQVGRILGTACKMDFQSSMLARNGRADLNSSRLVLYFADECHKYIISGSSTAGDPYFMNLSRSNNVVNICATQSYAWIVEVIGREAANVYISAFGVQFWLQQTDPETCRRASEICGTLTKEKVGSDHNLDFGGLRGSLGRGADMVIHRHRGTEEKERYRPEDFAHLNVGDIIGFNKGRTGRVAKVAKGRAQYLFCTQKPAGAAAVNARVREYYRELLENLTAERAETSRWECDPPKPKPAPKLGPEAVGEPVSFELSETEIELERADFAAYVGTLERAVALASGSDPSALAVSIEEARERAAVAENPADEFGALLCVGAGGVVSGTRSFRSPVSVPVDTADLPTSGSLASQLVLHSKGLAARDCIEARARNRAEADQPKIHQPQDAT